MTPPARLKSPPHLNSPLAAPTSDPLWRRFLPSPPAYPSLHDFQEDLGRHGLVVPSHELSSVHWGQQLQSGTFGALQQLLQGSVVIVPPQAQTIASALASVLNTTKSGSPAVSAPTKEHVPLPKEAVTTPAIGFRAWSVTLRLFGDLPIDATLGAITANGQAVRPNWETRGATRAKCERHGDEGVPHYPGTCGLYIYHAMPARNWVPEAWQVFGAVRAWGKVLVHEQGFRASVAQPVALAAVPGDGTMAWLNYELTRVTAQLMEVEMVPYQELRDVALQYGDPLEPGKFAAERS